MSGQNPVFIPGPTNIPDRLRFAMAAQTMDHRAPDFVELLAPLLDDLKTVFKTESGQVVTFPASGTGGWEAAITNTLSPGDKVLVARYGMFSHRWIDMCQRHGLDVVAAVRKAIDMGDHPALLFVDCVSSLATMDFRMDEWGVDLAVAGSQKGFMLVTGMAIIGVSQKAMKAMDRAKCPRTFFDFRDMIAANAKGGFPYTPPVQLMFGLRESLDMLFEEGLENVFARHHRIAEGVRKATAAWGLRLCARTPDLYSDSVSAIFVPSGFDSDALTSHAFDTYGVSFGVGLGEMAGKAFRIGHLGSLTDVMALSGIATIEMAMKDLNYPIELGAGVTAAQEYYRKSVGVAQAKVA
jgi:alanine-glyoxylate transaminase/serine-glyoxylate transaminase/serine-pyruvate transaminase